MQRVSASKLTRNCRKFIENMRTFIHHPIFSKGIALYVKHNQQYKLYAFTKHVFLNLYIFAKSHFPIEQVPNLQIYKLQLIHKDLICYCGWKTLPKIEQNWNRKRKSKEYLLSHTIQCPQKVWRQSYRNFLVLCCYSIYILIKIRQKNKVNDFT